MSACSLPLGWNALFRKFEEPLAAEFETLPTPDQLIVMVRRGGTTVESWTGRQWRSAQYRPGDLGMIAPGEVGRLRFCGPVAHETLQLHIPAGLLAQAGELANRPVPGLRELQTRHELTAAVMTALDAALEAGAAPLYAEAAVLHLVMQIVCDPGTLARPASDPGSRSLRERVDGFMRANLALPITLQDVARAGGIGVFQLIRHSKATWGVTPAARLTALRLDHARHLLGSTDATVTAIAMECGYENPSHFAKAFRRRYGVPPLRYRTVARG